MSPDREVKTCEHGTRQGVYCDDCRKLAYHKMADKTDGDFVKAVAKWRNPEYISAEKAKADKLALVNEIKGFVGAEYIPPPKCFVNETIKENNETIDVLLAQIGSIKQRIEAE